MTDKHKPDCPMNAPADFGSDSNITTCTCKDQPATADVIEGYSEFIDALADRLNVQPATATECNYCREELMAAAEYCSAECKIADLEHCNRALQDECQNLVKRSKHYESKAEELQSRVAELESEIQLITAPVEAGGGIEAKQRATIERLREYARHKRHCRGYEWGESTGLPCTCGLAELLEGEGD